MESGWGLARESRDRVFTMLASRARGMGSWAFPGEGRSLKDQLLGPVTPTPGEAEAGGLQIRRGSTPTLVTEYLSDPVLKVEKEVVARECLPGMWEALASIPASER